MQITNVKYPSLDGQTTIKGWLREPDEVAAGTRQPRALIQIVHGAAEHIGRYERLAQLLVDKGFAVCASDHIGHGRSAEGPADLGFIPATEGPSILVEDVHSLRLLAQPRYADNVPFIMLGHSMGSFITRVYLGDYGDGVDAAIISGTTHNGWVLSTVNNLLASMIANKQGERAYSQLLQNAGLNSYGRKMKDARTACDWLCTDEAVVDAYIADPLCGFPFSNGAYAALTGLIRQMGSRPTLDGIPKGLKLLFIAGQDDPVGYFGRGVQAAAKAYQKAGLRKIDVWIRPGLRHEVFNEPGWPELADETVSWLEEALDL